MSDDGFERLRMVLRRASAVGVGCHYWCVPEYGVPVEHLEVLGLAKPIKTQVPKCEYPGCNLLDACRHRTMFADKAPGIAGRKFRLTPVGIGAAESTAELAAQIGERPLARRILDAVAAAPEPLTGFGLYWRLLEPELEELAATGEEPVPRLSRPAVRFYLDLLIAAGWLREDPADGLIRRVDSN